MKLSKDKQFSAQEQAFELLDMSPTGYLVAVNYSVEKGREREMKPLLLKALRLVLVNFPTRKTPNSAPVESESKSGTPRTPETDCMTLTLYSEILLLKECVE